VIRPLPFVAPRDLLPAVEAVRGAIAQHGVIGVPTETFYGLAVDPGDRIAVERIFELKGRPTDRALPVVAASLAQVEALVHLEEPWRSRLAEAWPAPLSAVLPLVAPLPFASATLAVRIPSHPLLVRLLEQVGPLTATSANRSGDPSLETAVAVCSTFPDGLALVLDGGRSAGRLPSTLVDCTGKVPKLLRPGAFQPPAKWGVKPA